MNTAAVVLAFALFAQQIPTPLQHARKFRAELKKQISSNHSHVGDSVKLVALEDVVTENGTVLIPAGARMMGRVTLAREHHGTQPALLSLVLERAEWKKKNTQLNGAIVGVDAIGVRRRERPEMPHLRTAGPVAMPSASANFDEEPVPLREDCVVETSSDHPSGSSVVCHKGNVKLEAGARLSLVLTSQDR